MTIKLTGLALGLAAGFVMSWARISDPAVVRDMLLLRDAHLYLVMGSAVVVAAAGVRLLRAFGVRAFLTGDEIAWTTEPPQRRHVAGSALFGVGWCVAGTCPGPVAAMIGEGHLGGVAVAAGLMAGVTCQRLLADRRARRAVGDEPGVVGM
ncbi:MAG: YeeE/YedE family protein [Acidobacteria bacterium]|nr:YeeE/YedE family protein [Acidobacteriota bacterium]